MKNRLSFALLAASALALAGCSSINTALNTSKQPSMEKLTPPSGQAFLTLEGSGIQIFRCAADVFNGVKYIQRLKPEGGMPNSSGCTPSEAGKLLKVPFSAEYVFWK